MCRCAGAIVRAVVEFLDAFLVGCFLSFFRLRPGSRPRVDSPGSGRRDPLARKDRLGLGLGELLWDDEEGFGGNGGCHEDLADDSGIVEELRCEVEELRCEVEELRGEANYLKLCGAISETPAELRNVSYQINLENNIEYDNVHINTPAVEATSAFEYKSSEEFQCGEDRTLRPELNTEDNDHLPLVESDLQSALQDKSPLQSIKRKRVWTRKQFVYPILRPIENNLQSMELIEDSSPMLPSNSNPPKRRNLGTHSVKKPQQTSSDSVAKAESFNSLSLPPEESKYHHGTPKLLDDAKLNSDENHGVFSLSHWLKSSSSGDENQGDVECAMRGQLYDDNSLVEEGHVYMASEANWDAENPTPRLSKAWDCHGIPNSTTKYKEDQQVRWHTTPFEERLSKVLSEEEVRPTRKLVRGRLLHLDKRAES
ncbi:hypothetical protein GUJ93_ZPchr0006g45623 [Zizania palustris]|uniref:Protein JASON n=1 Tax=Zizania palustris TaxID=103762 RepID=A0A8J5SKY0_ZIZPA|nr:hypothetical protein GUJ93_ZPchr0006g45623 [Zizania palustris]